jgi:hypothetical protein
MTYIYIYKENDGRKKENDFKVYNIAFLALESNGVPQ